jgi:murein tripeptide amidase MpaA
VRERVNVIGPDRQAMADLVRDHRVGVVRQTLRRLPDGRWRVQAIGDSAELARLVGRGFVLEPVEALEVAEAALAASLGAERPFGRVAGYLDVGEVDRRLSALSGPPYGGVAKLLELPHATWEGRACHAVRIGTGPVGICVLGGVHAREWGSADIVVAFAERLLRAHAAGRGVAIGRRRFTAAQLARLVDEASLYLFPQVNPDGRHHSFTVDPTWRKNRRPGAAAGGGCVGVDLNRNFDFLWDYEAHFAPDAPVASSTDPCHPDLYVGPAAQSEPEVRNVVWLLDEHPDIEFLVDLHSYGELIMYSWGDDENQSRRRQMAFSNAAYDGRRGLAGDAYGEYLPSVDRRALERLARSMQAGIAASRGRAYRVQQSMNLYPTAGTSDDYAYSRHRVDPARTKVLSFTVEWGSEDNPTPFHPPYGEMVDIIAEVTSGLLAFCGDAVRVSSARRRAEV